MIRITITTVNTIAVTTKRAQLTALAGAVVLMPTSVSPLVTTALQSKAITNPNAVAREVEIAFRTAAIVDFRVPAMRGERWNGFIK